MSYRAIVNNKAINNKKMRVFDTNSNSNRLEDKAEQGKSRHRGKAGLLERGFGPMM